MGRVAVALVMLLVLVGAGGSEAQIVPASCPVCTWADVLSYLNNLPPEPDSFVWVEQFSLSGQTGYRVYRRYRASAFLGEHSVFKWLKYDSLQIVQPTETIGPYLRRQMRCDGTFAIDNVNYGPYGGVGLQRWWGGQAYSTPHYRVDFVRYGYNCFGEVVNVTTGQQTGGSELGTPETTAIPLWRANQRAYDWGSQADPSMDGALASVYVGPEDVPICLVVRQVTTGRTANQCGTTDTLLWTFYPVQTGPCTAQTAVIITLGQPGAGVVREQSSCACIPDGYEVVERTQGGTTCILRRIIGDPVEPGGAGQDASASPLPGVPDQGGDNGGCEAEGCTSWPPPPGGGGGGSGGGSGGTGGGGLTEAQTRGAVAGGVQDALESVGGDQPVDGNTYPTDVVTPTEAPIQSLVTSFVRSHPLVAALQGSGIQAMGAQCTVSGVVGGRTYSIDFCRYESHLQALGALLLAAAGVVAVFIVVGVL